MLFSSSYNEAEEKVPLYQDSAIDEVEWCLTNLPSKINFGNGCNVYPSAPMNPPFDLTFTPGSSYSEKWLNRLDVCS